ncbi:MAG: 2-oxo acid dehydrogenase subunit E2 [Candidatus Methanoperedens sp.]|nr:2-oxo acid dehydrogenase subunit E2 [Candidatus Methanoperedens sp.]MCE8429005.1 2-oxo acid dehydrogenase subunit E2 [Candidatus Methanoperedens sp.]
MVEIKFPDVGEGITEGTLVKWLVKLGDEMKADQAIAEIETDKAIVEIPAPKAGKVLKLFGKEGDILKVGSTLASLALTGEEISVPAASTPEKKIGAIKGIALAGPEISMPEKAPEGSSKILAAPATRRLARELGVDISRVTGSGQGGRIINEDIKKSMEAKPEIKPEACENLPEILLSEERIQIKGVRKTIGERMVRSLFTAPHVVSMDEADITELVSLREKEKITAKEKGVKLTYLAFIIKAATVALKQHPYLNASIDSQKNEIVLKHYYNIGIAVDTPEGLMVPVIKNADKKSIMELAKEAEDLAEEARTRKIKLSDLKGNTFTITNIGSIGGIFSTPIINPPDVAILGVHRIRDLPVVINGEIKPRKILPLVLSFDHRVLDGAQAARFMNTLIDHLRDPDLLLLDVT